MALLVALFTLVALRRTRDNAFRVEADPRGATVWIDGRPVGRAPVRVPALPPGHHRVRVVMEGYAPAELGFDLPEGVAPPPLRFTLERLEVSPAPTVAETVTASPTSPASPASSAVPSASPRGEATASRPPRTARARVPSPVPRASPSALPHSPIPVREGDLVAIDETVTPPRRVKGQTPGYPSAARRLRLLGTVRVDMIIDEHGVPRDLKVVESAGDILDGVVLEAVRDFRYEPARKEGVAVRVPWSYRQSFVAPDR